MSTHLKGIAGSLGTFEVMTVLNVRSRGAKTFVEVKCRLIGDGSGAIGKTQMAVLDSGTDMVDERLFRLIEAWLWYSVQRMNPGMEKGKAPNHSVQRKTHEFVSMSSGFSTGRSKNWSQSLSRLRW